MPARFAWPASHAGLPYGRRTAVARRRLRLADILTGPDLELWWWHDGPDDEPEGDGVTTFDAGYEGQTDTAAATTANSDDFGDSAMSEVFPGTAGAITYDNDHVNNGALALKFSQATSSQQCRIRYADGSDFTSCAVRFYIYLTGLPSADVNFPFRIFTSIGGSSFQVLLRTTGVLRLANSAGAVAASTTFTATTGVLYRVEVQASAIGGATTSLALQVFTGSSVTPETGGSISATNVTTGTAREFVLGKTSSATLADWWIDDLRMVTGSATALGPAGVNATATPAAVARAAAVPAPTVGAGATASPASVARAAAVPAPTVTTAASATASPASVAVVATIPAFTAIVSSSATPATVARAAVVPAPTVTSSVQTLASSVGVAAGVPGPTVTGTATVQPAAVTAPAVVPSVIVQTGQTATPAAVARPAAVPAPTVQTGASAAPASVAVAGAVPSPTTITAGNATAVVATVAAVAAVPGPVVQTGSTATPAALARAVAVPTVTVTAGADPTPATVAVVAAVPAPSVSTTASVVAAPASVARVAGLPAPTVRASAEPSAAAVLVAAMVPIPAVLSSQTVTPASVAAVVGIPEPLIGSSLGGSLSTGPARRLPTLTAGPPR